MISCCAHYLANILPAVGAAGIVTFVGQYQIQLFWFGLASNVAGILYIGSRVAQFAGMNWSLWSKR
jgi:Cu+-exporting ATPase